MTEQTFESIMETVCSICHRPYVETDQEELDAMCANCPVENAIEAESIWSCVDMDYRANAKKIVSVFLTAIVPVLKEMEATSCP